jgi:threonylcarbamoyladenosine tRNA methylthiotransferase MtaB
MNETKKIAFHTLGCKLNFSETSTISRGISLDGYEIVDFKEMSDIYVINTCSVTENAEKKCISSIKQANRRNPEAIIAVIGCFSELKQSEVLNIEGVDIVLGSNEKFNLSSEIENFLKVENNSQAITSIKNNKFFIPSHSSGDRTRSFLKIQDGCDYYCAYCTIPFARGASRSATIAEIVKTAKEIAATGMNEIVLTGINIGDFGKKSNETFLDLLKELDKITEIPRIRISSIEPDLLTDEIIELVANSKRFLPHFHISLQSASNKVLESMNRKYTRELFDERILKIKELIPNCCIATDVIVGYPSELKDDFLETLDYIEDSVVSYVHVFTYSERKNTASSRILEKVSPEAKRTRSEKLHFLSDTKKAKFYEENIGQTYNVLFESDNIKGYMHGYTENYIKVKTKYNSSFINKILPVTLVEVDKEGIFVINL